VLVLRSVCARVCACSVCVRVMCARVRVCVIVHASVCMCVRAHVSWRPSVRYGNGEQSKTPLTGMEGDQHEGPIVNQNGATKNWATSAAGLGGLDTKQGPSRGK